jgi:hypothetical protein
VLTPDPVKDPAPPAPGDGGTVPTPSEDKLSIAYVKAFWRLSVQAAIEAAIDFLDAVVVTMKAAKKAA